MTWSGTATSTPGSACAGLSMGQRSSISTTSRMRPSDHDAAAARSLSRHVRVGALVRDVTDRADEAKWRRTQRRVAAAVPAVVVCSESIAADPA